MKKTRDIDLSGKWNVRLDYDDCGIKEAWYTANPIGDSSIVKLPGSLQEQGFGDPPSVDTEWVGGQNDTSFYTEKRYEAYRRTESFKFPYWLQPDRRYIGPAWFFREVTLDELHRNRRLVLHLERPHWETRVWFDGMYLGSNDSLSVPHEYDLGTGFEPGVYRLAIRVDNRIIEPVGPNAHSVSDHTQGNWNGLVGAIELRSGDPVWIDNVQVVSSVRRHSATVRIDIQNRSGKVMCADISVAAGKVGDAGRSILKPRTSTQVSGSTEVEELSQKDAANPFEISAGETTVYREVVFDQSLRPWDEHTPDLVDLEIALTAHAVEVGNTGSTARETVRECTDRKKVRTGVREVRATESHISVNGHDIFLRGTLECCVFPLTGYPPTDLESWQRVISRAKAFGLNHLRFHSWCPPEAAFEAADEAGMYLQVECPSWANQGASVGENASFDDWLFREGKRIVRAYGNHPSFIMMAYGNEPAGRIEDFLALWVSHWKSVDDRRIYTSGAGWPAIAENDYHNIPSPRVQAWGAGLASRINAVPPETVTDYSDHVEASDHTIVSHEIGQWCVFPNFDEIEKYTGSLKPKNFEIFRDFLEQNGMGAQAHDFLYASGRLQVLCYKEDIESALRTPGFGGFQLLGLNDFPGQGTALVGVLDPFWDEKGYVRASEFSEFCGDTVLLARLPKRFFRNSETLSANVDIAHFGADPLENISATWELLDDGGTVVAEGNLTAAHTVPKGLTRIGVVTAPLAGIDPGRRYQLVTEIADQNIRNRWDLWIFADSLETVSSASAENHSQSQDLGWRMTRELDDEMCDSLESGATVLFVPPAEKVRSDVAIGFSSVFWNTAWTNNQAPHTLGIVCDPDHPCLKLFPTEKHSNWQWWELMHGSAAMVLNDLPANIVPIVQPIDTWFRCHRLGLLFEAKVGAGRILVCSMDIVTDLEQRLVARQMRYSIQEYLQSEQFNPQASLELSQLRALVGNGG